MQVGTLLAQRYRIEEPLGEGGMGVVFKAYDTLLERAVAIKTLTPGLLGDDGSRRIVREAQAVARLNHPYIVSIFDAVEDRGSFAIVMELVEGKSLRELMPVPIPQLPGIAGQILQALEYAHSQGIVHRDIKPENIIVTPEGTAKLMDFGLARSEGRSRLTQTGLIVGTVAYLAPEQALGGQVDGRTDLYSLGAVLYETVAGHPPFESDDPISVITQHINVPPVAPHWHNPAVPEALERIILKLLAKDPVRRYQSARDVLIALAAVPITGGTAVDQNKLAGPELVERIVRSPLVGRDQEMALLKERADRAIAGQGGVALLTGPLGVGKTRLVEELATFARLRGATVISGKAYESAPPYEPFAKALRDLTRGVDSETLSSRLGEFAPEVLGLVPELRRQLPRVEERAAGSSEERKNRLFAGVAHFLAAMAAQFPIVLTLDDMHLSDGASVELLQHVARRTEMMRVLLIVAYRPEDIPATPAGKLFAQVTHALNREGFCMSVPLHSLNQEQVVDLIKVLANHRTRPVKFGQRIFEVTEGNPYFIEEVIKGLFEQGTLYIKDGQWSTDFDDIKDYSLLEIPSSVHGAVEARLRNLEDHTRQVLTQAAVIGRQFSFDTLLAVTGLQEAELLDRIEEALRVQLIREVRGAGEDLYEFAQPMLRQVLYDAIPRRRRRLLHRHVGEVIERAARRAEGDVEALTLHFTEAEDPEKTLQYARLAARKAAAVFAYDSALSHLQQALEAAEELDRPADRIALMEQLGDTHTSIGHRSETIQAYEDALQLWKSQPSPALTDGARLYRKVSELARWGWYNPRTREHITEGLRLLEAEPQHPERIKLIINKASDLYWLRPESECDYVEAEKSAREGHRLAVAADSPRDISAALDALAGIFWQTADFPQMLAVTEQRAAVVKRLDDPLEVSDFHGMLERAHAYLGNYTEALRHVDEGFRLVSRTGLIFGQLHHTLDAAWINWAWDRWDEMERWCRLYDEAERRTGAPFPLRRRIAGHRAFVAAVRGDAQEAQRQLEEAATAQVGHPVHAWTRPVVQLPAVLALADYERARILAEECLRLAETPIARLDSGPLVLEFASLAGAGEIFEQHADPILALVRRSVARRHLGVTCRAIGIYHREQQRLDDAYTFLQEAHSLFDALDCRYQLARTSREIALLRRAQGRSGEALALLQESLTTFEALGAVRDVSHTRELT